MPVEKIKATFDVTTQYATNVVAGNKIIQTTKSPWPANNVRRRNEPVATDTVFATVPAIDDGSTMAQIFVGRKTLVADAYGMKSTAAFVNTLEDNIRQRGAMDKLITDGAKTELSARVKDILRNLCIDDWHSEANYQHQNFAEHRWKHIKRAVEWLMNRRKCPPEVWLLGLQYVCGIMNLIAEKSLGNRPPLQVLEGITQDISILLFFIFWDIVYVARLEDHDFNGQIGSEGGNLIRGRMVGFSHNVGHALTFKVLTDKTGKIIHRSRLRLASAEENRLEEARRLKPQPTRTFIQTKRDIDDPDYRLPTLEAFDDPFVPSVQEDSQVDQEDITKIGESHTDSEDSMPADRGAHTSEDRGATRSAIVDGLLRPDMEENSDWDKDNVTMTPLLPIDSVSTIYTWWFQVGTRIKRRFPDGNWYDGTVVSRPWKFSDEINTPR